MIVLGGLTPPSPRHHLFNRVFADLFPNAHLFGVRNTMCSWYCDRVIFAILQVTGYIWRKGYSLDPFWTVLVKIGVISPAIIWLFYTLASYRGIPVVLITVGIILIAYGFFTSSTVMGRHLYAMGGNEKAARLSGVKTNRLLFMAYVNMAFLAAVAGIVFAARLNSASPQAGQSFELDAIGACFIGGASAYGGVGTVGGTLIGAMIMGVLNNGMSIMGISSNVQQVVKGLVLLGAVAFDVLSKREISFDLFGRFRRRSTKVEETEKLGHGV